MNTPRQWNSVSDIAMWFLFTDLYYIDCTRNTVYKGIKNRFRGGMIVHIFKSDSLFDSYLFCSIKDTITRYLSNVPYIYGTEPTALCHSRNEGKLFRVFFVFVFFTLQAKHIFLMVFYRIQRKIVHDVCFNQNQCNGILGFTF